MKDALEAWRDDGWSPWTIWLPCVLAFTWSVLLIVLDGFLSLLAGGDTRQTGLDEAVIIGYWVLAAASVLVLLAGLSFPSRRRAAVITAWAIIPAGVGWVVLARVIG